jgi:integrase
VTRSRRGYGEGSVYQRPDGRWCAILSAGYDGNGKRIRRTVYGDTKKEAQDKLTKLQSSKLTGSLSPKSRLTVAQFLERWLQDVARLAVSHGTFVNYSGIVANHIGPRIGGVALQKLTPAHVQNLYAEIERSGAGPHARKLAHCVLHVAFKYAVRAGLASRNVCEAVDPPKITRRSMLTFDVAQAIKFLAAAQGEPHEALYWVALTTGLRLGELFGLQWRDIDLKAGTLSVCRSQSDVKGKLELKEPKTARGRRQVTLDADVVALLWRHRTAMLAAGHGGADRVFCNSEGGPLRRPDFHRRSFKPLLKRAGLPNIRFHDLRHTSATLLLSQGVHPKIVQERLGHSQISVTLDVYSHVMPGMQRDASDRLGELLRPTGENGSKLAVNAG